MDEALRRRSVGAPAARSALLTVLGEYVLGARDGVWQETLISALGTLGYRTQAARQALARSVTAGGLPTERHGRRAPGPPPPGAGGGLSPGAPRGYRFWAPRGGGGGGGVGGPRG